MAEESEEEKGQESKEYQPSQLGVSSLCGSISKIKRPSPHWYPLATIASNRTRGEEQTSENSLCFSLFREDEK